MTGTQDYHTIFQQDWWLDAVAPGHWDAVTVERGGTTQARLPFVIKEQEGLTTLGQAPLTKWLGPWVRQTDAGYSKTLGREMSLYGELISKLPRHDRFAQSFAPQVTNWLPFYWEGFDQKTRYTYVLETDQTLETLHANLDKRDRRQLRQASDRIQADLSDDLETFLRLNDLTFSRQGLKTPYSHEFVQRLDEAVLARAHRYLILARDKVSGEPHAGVYMVADDTRAYSLMSGQNPAFRDLNGGIVARWKAIEVINAEGIPKLDLQGSMMKSVERRNRKYGAVQVPYFSIYRSNGKHEKQEARRRRLRAPLLKAYRTKEKLLRPYR